MRAGVLALCLAAAPLSAAIPGPPRAATAPLTAEAFREVVATAIGKLRPGAVITRTEAQRLKVEEGGRETAQIYTGNAYAAYLADPAALTEIVRRYARLALGTSGDAELAQLVVIVRPATYLSENLRSSAQQIAPRAMAGDLAFFLAVDSPETIRTATADDLKGWNIAEAEAWARATANTKGRLGELAFGTADEFPGATFLTAESGLAPSLLAMPDICGPPAPTGVPSGQVVLLHSRETLLIGVPSEPAAMQIFWRTVKALIAGKMAWSSTPLTCRDGRWTVAPIP